MSMFVSDELYGVSVRETGAHGDGSADDTAAIQRALDIAHRVVTIPQGVYRLMERSVSPRER